HHAGEGAEHARLGAVRDEAGRRRCRKEAPVATLAGFEDGGLTVEEENTAVHEDLICEVAGVIHEIPGREVVRAVNDEIVLRDDLHRVVGGERRVMDNDVYVRIVREKRLLRRFGLLPADVIVLGEYLSLQVREVDNIESD